LLHLHGNNGYANARKLPLFLSLDGSKVRLQFISSAISLAVWGPAAFDMRLRYYMIYNYIESNTWGKFTLKEF
jgi:hypothetical protein